MSWKLSKTKLRTWPYGKKESLNDNMLKTAQKWVELPEPKLYTKKWYLIDCQYPFGQNIGAGKFILLDNSKFVVFGDEKKVFPGLIADVMKRTGESSIVGQF